MKEDNRLVVVGKQVLESETGLIWRTLDSRSEAEAWAKLASEDPKKK